MQIRMAYGGDFEWIAGQDRHISADELRNLLRLGRVYVVEEHGERIGWLRYNLFWDNTPFMNMLFIREGYRCQGYGRALVRHWEEEMKRKGHDVVMTSTASNECAQHFYNRLDYRTVGGFLPVGEPYELILLKEL